MAKKNQKKNLLWVIILVALVAGSAGFYYRAAYMPQAAEKVSKSASKSEWLIYQNPDGLEMKYPSTLKVRGGYESMPEFMGEGFKHTEEAYSVVFYPEDMPSKAQSYPIVYFYIFDNPKKVSVETWTSDFYAHITPPTDSAPVATIMPPEKITFAGKDGSVIRMGKGLELTYVFLPLKHNKILSGAVSNDLDLLDYKTVPMTKESEEFLFSILETVDDSNLKAN